MMTELEAVAVCTAIALRKDESGWAKTHADVAVAHAKALLKAGQIDTDMFPNVVERLAGNHSARKQRLERWGLIQTAESDSAEKRAILEAMEKLDKAGDQGLDKVQP